MGGGEELACRMMQSRKCLLERKRCEGQGKGRKKKEVALAAKLLETEGAAGYMCTAGYMRTAGKKRTKKEAALTARSLKTERTARKYRCTAGYMHTAGYMRRKGCVA